MTQNNTFDDWWKQAVVYQVYPRSFKDMNGDGLGDIAGVTDRMPYLQALGIDAIWLSPFYPSELADGGYDVIDYRNIDPRLGTLDDFDAMIDAAHHAGIKVIVDIVPNHTSDHHEWFEAALAAGRGSAERDRYIFREGRGEHGELPPNDWQSLFGESAWQQVEDGQWYLHLFTKEQPDLNWDNPDVHEEFKKTLRFWSDRGVDGFRIDVAHGLAKNLDAAPLEVLGAQYPVQQIENADGNHPLWDRPEVHKIYREWNEVFREYEPHRFAVAEAWVVPEHQYLYSREDELGQVFNFEFSGAQWTAADFRKAITEGLRAADESGSTTTWVMSNHDMPRHATRYGLPTVPANTVNQLVSDWLLRNGTTYIEDRELGNRRSRAAILMELGLPGSVYVYQGEELGLPEVATIPWDRLEDPVAFNTNHGTAEKGRDGCRVPLPWNSTDMPQPAEWSDEFGEGTTGTFGFSPAHADAPHLPQPLWFKQFCADIESEDDSSMLNLYRRALALRQSLLTSTHSLDFTWNNDDYSDQVIAYSRPIADESGDRFACFINFGKESITLPNGEILLKSSPFMGYELPTDTAVWMRV
ncbi:alpha-amylase [Bifidobacterium dolichotidis]|uniref:Alpha-amylase n=1 Tax=Bifidobacterium dolichotidis TaxID=2306976 RepID=A0A430FKX2_9BIFI|nr:glycoside hydrolase family 13 protein [Bifidobacterium dolichotidis]RSX53402.1 alpha-amylase [Bifidobacterium dolichotidis]